MKPLLYLGAPYSHIDTKVVEERLYQTNRAAAWLFSQGFYVFSPISHTHPIFEASSGCLQPGFSYWRGYALYMLDKSNALVVLCLSGWTQSIGLNGETAHALKTQIPIFYLCPSSTKFEWIGTQPKCD